MVVAVSEGKMGAWDHPCMYSNVAPDAAPLNTFEWPCLTYLSLALGIHTYR